MAIWNTEGYLIKNTGISNSHMAYFDNQSQRESWFKSKQVIGFNEVSFIRPDSVSKNGYESGSVHLNISYDDLSECDYVMFRNKDIDSTRWFYARIITREYVNVNSTRLWFKLDYYSTYSDLITFNPCFVERSHIKESDDWNGNVPNNGENILNRVPESISYKPIYEPAYRPQTGIDYNFILISSEDNASFTVTNGIPITYNRSFCGSVGALQAAYNGISNKDNIIRCYCYPKDTPENITIQIWSKKEGFKNSKTLSPQFLNYSIVSPTSGSSFIVNYQEFSFQTMQGEIKIESKKIEDINGKFVYYVEDRDDKSIYLDCPETPVTKDGYDVWRATQGKANDAVMAAGILTTVAGIAGMALAPTTAGLSIGAGVGVTMAGVGTTASAVGQNMSAVELKDSLVGAQVGTDILLCGNFAPIIYRISPGQSNLKSIDTYFSCYGYAIERVIPLNFKVRQKWTYLKTRNCSLRGALPINGIAEIESLLNNGCTFWNCQLVDIGSYGDMSNPDS